MCCATFFLYPTVYNLTEMHVFHLLVFYFMKLCCFELGICLMISVHALTYSLDIPMVISMYTIFVGNSFVYPLKICI